MPDYTARDKDIGAPKLGLQWRLRVAQSVSATVEEDSQVGFHIGLIDLQEGALSTGDIDDSNIVVTIEKSTSGGAFSSGGITPASFSEASGRVYIAYRFLQAEWAVGDMYRLTVSGITCTIGNETAYVPSVVWSNLIVESSELAADVNAIITDLDNATDGLGALKTLIEGIGGLGATDKGVTQTLELAVTSAANAGDTTLATVASGSVIVTKIVVFAVTAQHANMTNAAVKGGAGKVLTFIDATDLVRADVDAADKQVAWSGKMRLNTGDTILMEHSGTGAGALDLVIAFTFHASSANGATMS